MTLEITSQQPKGRVYMSEEAQKKQPQLKAVSQPQTKSVSFWDDAWTGEQVRKLGLEDVADFLTDKDKVCTDGQDDGKISIWEKAKAAAKGLVFGIPKAIVNHPLMSTAAIALGAGAMFVTGGAALPLLIGAGVVAGGAQIGIGAYKAATAETDGEAKAAWEGIGTGTATIGLSAMAVKSANQAAAKGGVKSLQGLEKDSWWTNFKAMFKAIPEATKQSGLNIKGNYLTWKTGMIHANSNATRSGVETGIQAGNKVDDAYKVDLNGTVEEVLAKNPGLSYDAETGKYYVQTSWGDKSYIQNDNYMFVKYGEGDCNAVDGVEFYDTYIDHAKFEATGAKRYINPQNLKPGEHVVTSKNAPARFKVVPEGTKYVGAEGEATVQPGSVLRIDGQGRPYQSTVEFMLKKVQLTDEQIGQLYTVDPKMVYKYKPEFVQKFAPENYAQMKAAEEAAKAAEEAAKATETTAKAAAETKEVTVQSVRSFLYDFGGRTNFDHNRGVYELVVDHPEYIERLAALKNPDGTQMLSEYDILYNIFDANYETMSTNPEAIFAILENPEEMAWIRNPNSGYVYFDSSKLINATKHPLASTRTAHPELFAPEQEVTLESVTETIQTMEFDVQDPTAWRADGITAMKAHPEIAEKMALARTTDGRQLFTSEDIAHFLCNEAKNISSDPTRASHIISILDNPTEMSYVDGYASPGFGFWRIVNGG